MTPITLPSTPFGTRLGNKTQPTLRRERPRRIVSQANQTSLLKTYCAKSAITGSQELVEGWAIREVQPEDPMKVYIGIDWSEEKHDICWMNEKGEVIRTLQIRHSLNGFVELDKARQALGVESKECVVGLETAHNLMVDFLWDRGYEQVYILPPTAVKSSQGRFRQAVPRMIPGMRV